LQQTEAHEASHQQLISQRAEEAITLSQNHSRQVATQFYNVRNLRDASIIAAKTHEELYGVQTVPQISSEEDEEYLPEEENLQVIEVNRLLIAIFSLIFN
jgi:hypothetical protein